MTDWEWPDAAVAGTSYDGWRAYALDDFDVRIGLVSFMAVDMYEESRTSLGLI